MVIGQIIAGLRPVKSVLKNFHARETSVLQQLFGAGGDLAQILGDDVQFTQFFFQGTEEGHAGALLHGAVFGSLIPVRNFIIGIKADEVIDPDHIHHLIAAADPVDPPGIAGFLHLLPVIDGVAPELACRGMGIRRAAGDNGRYQVLIELEGFRMCPAVNAVEGYIEGNIADDLYLFFRRVGAEFPQLPVKDVLDKAEERNGLRAFCPDGLQGAGFTVTVRFFPVEPGFAFIFFLKSHIQGVILQPEGLFLQKSLKAVCLLHAFLTETAERGPQYRQTVVIHGAVIHALLVGAEISVVTFIPCQQSFLDQILQTDEIRVSGESGNALIRGIAEAGRSKRQDLPVTLACFMQKVYKLVGFFGKTADPEPGRQGGHRE